MALGIRELRPDPILTAIAQEYGTGGGFAYEQLVPRREVTQREFKYFTWDLDKYLSDHTESLRAPGDSANEDLDPGQTSATGLVVSHAKKQKLTDEVMQAAPNPAAVERAKIQKMVWSLRRAKELRFRDLVNATGSIGHTSPSVKWDASTGTITIEADVDAAKEEFLKACGFEPTHLLLPPAVAKVVKRDSTVRALRKFTDERLLINGELPPVVWGLNLVVPGAIVNGNAAGVAPGLSRIWSTDNAVLMYVNPAAATDPEAMTAIAEFGLNAWPSGPEYGTERWRDPDKSRRTDWISTEATWMMERTALAIYILDNVLT